MKTPKNQKNDAQGQNKSSGKKLVQARLPFKTLSTPTGDAEDGGVTTKERTEGRKRKLSYDDHQEDVEAKTTERSSKRRSIKSTKGQVVKKTKEATVVVLSDSNDNDANGQHDSPGCKENFKTVARSKLMANKEEESTDMHVCDDVELIESSDEEEAKDIEKKEEKITDVKTTKTPPGKKAKIETAKTKTNLTKTPLGKATRKSATPQSGKKATGNGRKSAGDEATGSKLQIKLPVAGKKNKRRKPAAKAEEVADEEDIHEDLSDDTEVISKNLHPQKRPKLDVPVEMEKKTDKMNMQTDKLEKLTEERKESSKKNIDKGEAQSLDNDPVENEVPKKTEEKQGPKKDAAAKDLMSKNEQKSKTLDITNTTSDLESDSEADTTDNSELSQSTTNFKQGNLSNVADQTTSPKVSAELSVNKMQKKNLTPKQQKLVEQRMKAREEKERKIQEERLQKQREKEEREQAKKREREEKEEQRRKEREEKEEQRRKEREEKEEQRRKEREEKEQKRLADIEAKNEEKRKRIEAKEEEQRKKEDDRKRKEQEKEEEKMKKQKAAMAFTKFFSRQTQDSIGTRSKDDDDTEEIHDMLAFRPFQVKGDMKLAPIVRKRLTDDERKHLSAIVEERKNSKNLDGDYPINLYLSELKSGSVKPYKWCRPNQNDVETVDPKDSNDDDEDDVLIIEDELERVGQEIVEEHDVPIERIRAKFYKFDENRRPPYYGTWRKKSAIITPRRPFAQDKKFFDYEVDSDDEWEEEEPGESLDGSDDDKEKESEDEDYEVDNEWFVPHGHLSEEEMQNEDELGESNDREAQKAKLQILQQEFAQEMKKKTEKLKPRLIGCIWVDENGNQPELCPKIIWDTLNMRSILYDEPPIMEEIIPVTEKNNETNISNGQNGEKGNGEVKLKPITLTDEMLKQLVRLIHGNTHSKNFLIQEYIAYIEANEESVRNGDVRVPLKSAVREKIDEFAKWQIVEAANENKKTKTPKTKKKLCWIVSEDILEKMNLEIDLNNNWKYLLQPRNKTTIKPKDESAPITQATGEDSTEINENGVEQCNRTTAGNATPAGDPQTPVHNKINRNPDIKKFTKVLTAEEKAQQLQKQRTGQATPTSTGQIKSSPHASKINNSHKQNDSKQSPVAKKRVPLLISVARGQTISTPDKNARISQFLKTINDAKQKEKDKTPDVPTPMETDEVVMLD